ncbi:MAG: hypothetical protein NOU37_00530 [Candidatus Brocadiales bacterium]|nr:hypothetical protein [Candidatus Bathyanammoxibius amoris]
MAFKAKNPEKVVSCCPVGIRKSQCPSIGVTRMLRKEILWLARMTDTPLEKLDEIRKKLRDKKKAGITADCPTCPHNTGQVRKAEPVKPVKTTKTAKTAKKTEKAEPAEPAATA